MKKLSLQGLLPGILATVLSLLTSASMYAQVAINTTGNAPDTTAMLDVSSSDKGILIPRMDSTSRTAILQPADGLMVYDTTTTTFWYYDEERWNEIRNGETKLNAFDFTESLPEIDPFCAASLTQLSIPTNADRIAYANDYVYLLGSDAIYAVNVSNPDNPILEGTLTGLLAPFTDFSDGKIEVSNNVAYVAAYRSASSSADQLVFIDISDPSNMSIINQEDFNSSNDTDLTINGNYAYVISSVDLNIIELSDLINLNFTDIETLPARGVDIAVSGNQLYVVTRGDLVVFDISNPARASEIGSLSLPSGSTALVASGNYVYVLNSTNDNLTIIDVSVPTAPAIVSSLPVGGSPSALEIAGNYLYIVDTGSDDLKIIDVSDPNNPVLIKSIAAGNASSIALSGNYAYVSNGNLRVFALSCPFSLVIDPSSGEMTAASTIELPNALGDHTATMDLDMANFSIVNGEGRLMVADNGEIGIGTTEPQATLDLHGADDNTRGRIIARRGSRNSYIAMVGPGNSPYHSTVEVAQLNTGTVETAIAISNQNNASFGYVGIGRVPTTNRLEVKGQASKNMAGDWLANSDARLKKNIQQLDANAILKKLLALKGVTYEWNDNKTTYERPEGIQYGFTAQNIQAVFPTLVEEDADGYLQTAYGTYDAMYVEAFRALQQQITDQQEKNTHQQRQIDALRAENQQLQQQVARIQEVEATLANLQRQLSSPDHSTTTTTKK